MLQEKNLLISIITPTFNRGRFLEKNILSIKNQDYPYIEHIIIDGASGDNTLDLLKQYEGTYNMKWISERDSGCADAMNKGFAMAQGNIVCWLDSDDFYLPGTLKKIAKIFQKKPTIDVVFGDNFVADGHGVINDYVRHTDFEAEDFLYVTMPLGGLATFWRSSVSKKVGTFNTTYKRIADADYFLRMKVSGARFYHLREFLAIAVKHEEQLSGSEDIVTKEGQQFFKEYGDKKLSSKALIKKRRKLLVKRALNYIKQGDLWYVVRGITHRWK